ncbi:MAG: cyclodeaminase/cyclohydrolase family protein [Phycisphaerales bacterium]
MNRQTFDDLLASIAAKTPAPGGGAVASAVGALAAALGSMVVAYSVGKKSLAEHEAPLRDAATRLENARAVLLALAGEDAAAFSLLSELQRLPEGDARRASEEGAAREAVLQAPRAVLAASLDLLRLLESLVPITNRHLRSDLAIAAVLAEATARSAAWNVSVNLPLVPDEGRRADLERETARMIADARSRASRVEGACARE